MKDTIFKLIAIAFLAVLFYSSEPARNVTSDGLKNTADFIRP